MKKAPVGNGCSNADIAVEQVRGYTIADRPRYLAAALLLSVTAETLSSCFCDDVLKAARPAAERPRMLFDVSDIPALRAKIAAGGLADNAMDVLLRDAALFVDLDTDPYAFHSAVAGRALAKQVFILAVAGYVTVERNWIAKATELLCALARQSDAVAFAKLNGALAVGGAVHRYTVGHD